MAGGSAQGGGAGPVTCDPLVDFRGDGSVFADHPRVERYAAVAQVGLCLGVGDKLFFE